jgi:hypothetical protein
MSKLLAIKVMQEWINSLHRRDRSRMGHVHQARRIGCHSRPPQVTDRPDRRTWTPVEPTPRATELHQGEQRKNHLRGAEPQAQRRTGQEHADLLHGLRDEKLVTSAHAVDKGMSLRPPTMRGGVTQLGFLPRGAALHDRRRGWPSLLSLTGSPANVGTAVRMQLNGHRHLGLVT